MKSHTFVVGAVVALGLAACTPADAPKSGETGQASSTTPAPEMEAEYPNYDEPLTTVSLAGCEVILNLSEQAIDAGKLTLDRAVVHSAWTKYQTQFEANYSADERAQLVASTMAFHDQLTPDQLRSSAEVCLGAQDRTFTRDDG